MGLDPGYIAGEYDIPIDRLDRNIGVFRDINFMDDIAAAIATTILAMRVVIDCASLPFLKLQLPRYTDMNIRIVKAHLVIVIVLIVIDIDQALDINLVHAPTDDPDGIRDLKIHRDKGTRSKSHVFFHDLLRMDGNYGHTAERKR
jgi:hypothetical protein